MQFVHSIIEGSTLATSTHPHRWHPEHFVCVTCTVPFPVSDGRPVCFPHMGLPYCEKHIGPACELKVTCCLCQVCQDAHAQTHTMCHKSTHHTRVIGPYRHDAGAMDANWGGLCPPVLPALCLLLQRYPSRRSDVTAGGLMFPCVLLYTHNRRHIHRHTHARMVSVGMSLHAGFEASATAPLPQARASRVQQVQRVPTEGTRPEYY